MIANYHTHTPRCHHAIGTEREYIEQAIIAGMKELGFSDHVPYRFPNFQSRIRMEMDEVSGYIQMLSDLRKEYQKDIQIYIGFEAEYFPELFDDLLEELSQYPYDYMLLGQHFLEPEPIGYYVGNPVELEQDLERYVDLVLEGLATKKFAYLAHPDLVNYVGSDLIYQKHMKRLCKGAKEMEIPLEINFTGYMEGRNYPCSKFFKIASEMKNQVILGCDAHRPEVLTRKDLERDCRKMAESLSLEIIDKLLL